MRALTRAAVAVIACALSLAIAPVRAEPIKVVDGQTPILWTADARLHGVALPPVRWVSLAGVPGGLRVGMTGTAGLWNVQLRAAAGRDGEPVLVRLLTHGQPPQNVSDASTLTVVKDHNLIRARSADGSSRLALRYQLTVLHTDRPMTRDSVVAPVCPAKARAKGIEGVVMLQVDQDASGKVLGARVQSSKPPGVFDVSALRAVAFWQLNPARDAQGIAIASTVRIPVEFKLDDAEPRKRKKRRTGRP